MHGRNEDGTDVLSVGFSSLYIHTGSQVQEPQALAGKANGPSKGEALDLFT